VPELLAGQRQPAQRQHCLSQIGRVRAVCPGLVAGDGIDQFTWH
jgi:hypothetical protein